METNRSAPGLHGHPGRRSPGDRKLVSETWDVQSPVLPAPDPGPLSPLLEEQ